jgi:hypothetical protein
MNRVRSLGVCVCDNELKIGIIIKMFLTGQAVWKLNSEILSSSYLTVCFTCSLRTIWGTSCYSYCKVTGNAADLQNVFPQGNRPEWVHVPAAVQFRYTGPSPRWVRFMIHHTSRHFPCCWFRSIIGPQSGTDLWNLLAARTNDRTPAVALAPVLQVVWKLTFFVFIKDTAKVEPYHFCPFET